MKAVYNRYIRNDQGLYTRIPEEESAPAASPEPRPEQREPPPFEAPPGPPPSGQAGESGADGISGALRRLLDQLHLGELDTGDLLLLAILYLLFREWADEELLAALGLLLIL